MLTQEDFAVLTTRCRDNNVQHNLENTVSNDRQHVTGLRLNLRFRLKFGDCCSFVSERLRLRISTAETWIQSVQHQFINNNIGHVPLILTMTMAYREFSAMQQREAGKTWLCLNSSLQLRDSGSTAPTTRARHKPCKKVLFRNILC
ncbi:unnamed protein product [Lathyrus sativus]|nr:unnamed protein product [Lathyrus sativus]